MGEVQGWSRHAFRETRGSVTQGFGKLSDRTTHRSCACEFDRRVWKRIAWLLTNRQTAQPGTRCVFAG